MSSGHTSKDRKTIGFDLTSSNMTGYFLLSHLDGNELNPDKILMQLSTNSASSGNTISCKNSIIIDKNQTIVLSHMFRHMADLMDEWYKKNSIKISEFKNENA